jgi:ribonuclease HI
VLEYGVHRREFSGGEVATTNNRMELRAAIEGLSALKTPCRVEFFTDSQYVKNGMTLWIEGWKRKGWRMKSRKPVKNMDLWQALDAAVAKHTVTWRWVKGHTGQAGNECCDLLANAAMDRIEEEFPSSQRAEALKQFQAASPSVPGWDGFDALAPSGGA